MRPSPAPTEPGYAGEIASSVSDSTPWWPAAKASSGPNIVMVVLDDVGFAQLGCYGSSVATPHIDALAAHGLRYTNFHVPALCSPTRACLLTGRNHHSVGMGFLAAFDTGFPGYRGAISPAASTIAEMLHGDGYASYAVGKWHLTPPHQLCPAGPFDQWPTQRGFDRYYGFMWGEDDQWQPELWHDQHRVAVPDRPGYHLSEDLADRATEYISDHLTNRPDNPFFCYLAFGACHAPHQAPEEYLQQYRGKFAHGWDIERQRILERQLDAGIVPAGTRLSEPDDDVARWSELSDEEQRVFARLQEAFAGFLTHTDAQIGRLVAFLRDRGVLDDTVIMVMSDNGASGEGGRDGTINEYRYFLGLDDSIHDAAADIDQIGGPSAHNQYPAGWALTGNTPLRYYKKFTYGGGVRAPLIVHWPNGIESSGLRRQFHHAIDVTPTLLELAGVEPPATYRGVEQLPVHGMSMRYSFDADEAAGRRDVQYFETVGHRGVYANGWKAVTNHRRGDDFAADRWQLFDLTADFAETTDLAATHPERLSDLTSLWWEQADAYGVLPLDDRMGERVRGHDPAADRRRYIMLPGTSFINQVVGPNFAERSFSVAADAQLADDDAGVLLAFGRRAFGFSLFVKDGLLTVDYNLAGRHTIMVAGHPISVDRPVQLRFDLDVQPGKVVGRLMYDDLVVAEQPFPRAVPGGIGTLSLQCGHNAPSPVSEAYVSPFAFTGRLKQVVIELGERDTAAADTGVAAELAQQ